MYCMQHSGECIVCSIVVHPAGWRPADNRSMPRPPHPEMETTRPFQHIYRKENWHRVIPSSPTHTRPFNIYSTYFIQVSFPRSSSPPPPERQFCILLYPLMILRNKTGIKYGTLFAPRSAKLVICLNIPDIIINLYIFKSLGGYIPSAVSQHQF